MPRLFTRWWRRVDAIVHLGGVSVERPFEEILPANIQGTYHLYEAARRHGVRRIVFASSNHVIGFYQAGRGARRRFAAAPGRLLRREQGVRRATGQFYFDRYGIETVALRIGSSFPEAKDRRMLVTWLGYDDLEQPIRRAVFVPEVGFTIVYGASANRDSW